MDRIKSDAILKTQSRTIIEKSAQDLIEKFSRIEVFFQKIENEELGARDKLRRVIQDLAEDVNQAEQKHKKIQEFLKNFKDC